MQFELRNDQRIYFGLEPIKPEWERVMLKGDTYREESILYFEGDIIKRYIISTKNQYKESQYDDLTRSRTILLPKTSKGKEKKLTASVLESRQPTGVYCLLDAYGRICIGNYNTQTTFYNSLWENHQMLTERTIAEWVEDFIKTAPENYLPGINAFKKGKRKNAKFKPGDFFAFKINRAEYGFGRILLDIDALKKAGFVHKEHGLSFMMTKPILVKTYAYKANTKKIDLNLLEHVSSLPSDYMMDNLLLYGEYEVIGHKDLRGDELDFPMSYGRHIASSKHNSFLQWGLIHLEQTVVPFNKYFIADNPFVNEDSTSRKVTNPYGYYGIGFRPKYGAAYIKGTIENNGAYDFERQSTFMTNFDLRNPQNLAIRNEIMAAFGLDPAKSYDENCELTKTIKTSDLLKLLNKG